MAWTAKQPWRCWERLTLAGILNGPESLLVRVALFNKRTKIYQTEFRWPALDRLGPNAYNGSYSRVILRFGDIRWSFETAGTKDGAILAVHCLDAELAGDVEIRLETFYQRPGAGKLLTREREVIARSDSSAWRVSSPSPSSERWGSTLVAPLARPFVAVIEPATEEGKRPEARTEGEPPAADKDARLTEGEMALLNRLASARKAFRAGFDHVPPEYWWAYAGTVYGLGWNLIWAEDLQEPVEVTSRDWCVHGNYGEWVLFNWDQPVVAAAAAQYDVDLAHQIIRPQIELQQPDGLIPGVGSPFGVSADRGMPPTIAYGMWKAYLFSKDASFVTDYYDALCRYHDWWRRNRDGNGDGLLEWGSNPVEAAHPQWQAHTYWASRYETGMDNHPMWDDTPWNPKTNTQEQSDVGLNALYALDAICLSHMAALLGKDDEARQYREESEAYAARIDAELWNEETGLWLSRRWDGTWEHHASPLCLMPICLPGVDREHIRRAIAEHIRNPRRFGGEYMMPVSPRDDPAYPDQYYVRGRVWPEQTLLVHAALREIGDEETAAEVANGALRTFRREWLECGHLHENYNAETADGEDTPESDPLYSFGTMMPFIGWLQLRDVRLDGSEVTAPLSSIADHLDRDGSMGKRIDPVG